MRTRVVLAGSFCLCLLGLLLVIAWQAARANTQPGPYGLSGYSEAEVSGETPASPLIGTVALPSPQQTQVLAIPIKGSKEPFPSRTPSAAPNVVRPQESQTLPAVPSAVASTVPFTLPAGSKRLVVIDPGHGGNEVGAARSGPGPRIAEKELNLSIAKRVAGLLEDKGYRVVLTRSGDSQVNNLNKDLNADGKVDVDDDLQARVDFANSVNADLLLSIHHNGSQDTSLRGTNTYYCRDSSSAAASFRLATLIQASLEAKIGAFEAVPAGRVQDDARTGNSKYGHLFLLGYKTPRVARTANMPVVLGEGLFLSNAADVGLLRKPEVLKAMAEGYSEAINSYFSAR